MLREVQNAKHLYWKQMMFFLFSEVVLYVSCQVVAEIPCYPNAYIVIYKRKGRILHVLLQIIYPLLCYLPLLFTAVFQHNQVWKAANISLGCIHP